MTKKEQGNGEVVVDIDKQGIHVMFTNTPKWAYILIAIGLMFLLTFIGHAVFSYYNRVEKVDKPLSSVCLAIHTPCDGRIATQRNNGACAFWAAMQNCV